ncbi:MAG TPA: class I SAM-dependent methyltransferase, partial [Candidatus Acidoferrum sp.]|nr:class I SAM-dependent methyltransferase [Candidatus Acidoferrum sp.]
VSLLLSKSGYNVTAADLSPAMIKIATDAMEAARASVTVHHRDIEALDYNPQSFDSVICFRLFHHFPSPEIRARAVAELCRVARRHVLISYFSPWSFTGMKRTFQQRCFGKAQKKFHTRLPEVTAYFEANRFKLVGDFAQLPLIHTLHLAVFERES